jgi:hypothetical protein
MLKNIKLSKNKKVVKKLLQLKPILKTRLRNLFLLIKIEELFNI